MKLSDVLNELSDSGDFGLALVGLSEKAKDIEDDLAYAIEQAEGWYNDGHGGHLNDERLNKYHSILGIKSPN